MRGTQDALPEPEGEADDDGERPAYKVTATQPQARYAQTLAAIQQVPQQQQR